MGPTTSALVEWARPLTIIGWLAGTLVIPGVGIALLIKGRRERRLGRESRSGAAVGIGVLAVVSVWLAIFASAIPVLVGITPTTNTPKAVMAVLVDALLIYLFRPERRPCTQQEPVDEVEPKSV